MKSYLFCFLLLLSVVAISCNRKWHGRRRGCHDDNNFEIKNASRKNYSPEWQSQRRGCRGKQTKFETEDSRRGNSTENTDVCRLPTVVGPCRGSIPRYYWDDEKKDCLKFNYGGCDGNGNNFETVGACQVKCGGGRIPIDICSLPPVTGPCRGAMTRYYWDTKAKDCLKFDYGGCDGNENNFEAKEACLAKCVPTTDVCSLPEETGPCYDSLARYRWDTRTKKCVLFSYGGCGGNINNFETEAECLAKCNPYPQGCKLSLDIGDCFGAITRYFYNETLRGCQKFSYTGCGGNANNFYDNTTCEETCYAYPRLCTLKSEPGPCTGDIKRYYWNNDAKECQEFSYGGCQGNENNFKTIRQCNKACNTYPSSCQLEPHSGPCPVNGTRYYWNKDAGECQSFPYGCLGNQNNFKTIEVCKKTCS